MISFNNSTTICDRCLKIMKTNITLDELNVARNEPQVCLSCFAKRIKEERNEKSIIA